MRNFTVLDLVANSKSTLLLWRTYKELCPFSNLRTSAIEVIRNQTYFMEIKKWKT